MNLHRRRRRALLSIGGLAENGSLWPETALCPPPIPCPPPPSVACYNCPVLSLLSLSSLPSSRISSASSLSVTTPPSPSVYPSSLSLLRRRQPVCWGGGALGMALAAWLLAAVGEAVILLHPPSTVSRCVQQ